MSEQTSGNPANGEAGTPGPNPSEDVAHRYFSIEVGPPSANGSGADTESYNYFRMGAPYEEAESKLPPDPAKPKEEGKGTESPWEDGLLLYSTGALKVIAPKVEVSSEEDLEVVSHGKNLTLAKWTKATPDILGATEITYQHLNELKASIGTSLNAILGIEQTFWNGIYTHYGIGSALDAVLGAKIEVHAAKQVAFQPGHMGQHGRGKTEATENFNVVSAGPVRLSSSPGAKQILEGGAKWSGRIKLALSVLGAAAPAVLAVNSAVQNAWIWSATESNDELKKFLTNTQIELGTLMAVFTVIQASIALYAILWRTEQTENVREDLSSATAASLWLDGETPSANRVHLKAGNRTLIFDNQGNITLSNGNANSAIAMTGAGGIRISTGNPGPSIAITGSSIVLSVGTNSLTIDDSGIKLGAPDVQMQPMNAQAYSLVTALGAGVAAAQEAQEAAGYAELFAWVEQLGA